MKEFKNKLAGIVVILVAVALYGCKSKHVKKEIYSDGNLKSITTYNSDSSQGCYLSYYENGKLKDSCELSQGLLNGLDKSFFENGRLSWVAISRNGRKNGYYRKYYENGNLQCEAFYKDDVPDSISKLYSETGQLEEVVSWRLGSITKRDIYYTTGKVKKEFFYNNGEVEGHVNFDEDGVPLTPSTGIVFPKGKKDTIKLGETFIAYIIFSAHNINATKDHHVFIGTLNDNDSLTSISTELTSKNDMYQYEVKPNQLGVYRFCGVLEYTKENGHVVRAPFRGSCYVKAKKLIKGNVQIISL